MKNFRETHEHFAERFATQLDIYAAAERIAPGVRLFVIPFSFYGDMDTRLEVGGAIWLPDEYLQDVGALEHWRLPEGLRDDLDDCNVESHGPYMRGILELKDDLSMEVRAHDVAIYPSAIPQIESDYNVKFRTV